MIELPSLLFPCMGFAVAWLMTGALRQLSLHLNLLDHPNDRSSHVQPTPRGGGLAIVVPFALATGFLWYRGDLSTGLAQTLLLCGSGIALIGLLDDRYQLPAKWRFCGHLIAAGLAATWLLPSPGAPATMFAFAASTLLVAWGINLFNFMDGINGIAGVQAITVALAGAMLCELQGSTGHATALMAFAGCAAGFLVWNFPHARIFMGDAGSGFVGIVLAAFGLASAASKAEHAWSWLILTAAFMTDATVTLIRRVLRGEKFYLAHRSHAYQYASRLYKSHKVVTLAFGAINVFWLFPWALAVALGWINGVVAVVIAYTPLVLLAFHYKAGDRAAQGDLA